jgi:integrase
MLRRARWDLNPGPPAPQAGVIIRQHGQNPVTPDTRILDYSVVLDDEPAYAEYNQRIINTLQQMASDGRKRATIKSATWTLKQLNRKADLMNPESVKKEISELKNKNGEPASDAKKHKMIWNYNYFVKTNGLQWIKPKYKYDLPVPITPTKEQAETIIASAPSMDSATLFRILLETGFEGMELHCTTMKHIDTEQGIITVEGHKQHNGRQCKLKAPTAEMLRLYLSTRPDQLHPFPKSQTMWDLWEKARNRAASKLSRPDLRKIPLKGLRNLSGILMWQKTHDPWTVMLHMGHKKLDTTQHYLRAMTAQMSTQEQEWISKAVQLGTPATLKEIMELIEAGFRKETEADGYQIFRKPK